MFKEYPELLESYNLSMYFRSCYENKRISFEQWVKKVETTSLKELKIAAETIKRNLCGIKNYFHNRAINAAVESFHSKLKLFRQRIGGIVDKEYFFLRTIQYFA